MPYNANIIGYHIPEKAFHKLPQEEKVNVEAEFFANRKAIITNQHEAGWVNKPVAGNNKTERDNLVKDIINNDLQNHPDTVPPQRAPVQFELIGEWNDLGNNGHEADQMLSLSNMTQAWQVSGTTSTGAEYWARLCVYYKIETT